MVPVRNSGTRPGLVPQLNIPEDDGTLPSVRDGNIYTWNNMLSPLLTRISFATASSMSILPMPPGTLNSTYVMDFHGPSLKCDEPTSGLLDLINQVVSAVEGRVAGNLGSSSIYTAFTPYLTPYLNYTANSTDFELFADDCILGGAVCSFVPGNVSTYASNGTTVFGRSDPLVMRLDEDYTCALKNTSYSMRFRSVAEQRNLELISFEWQDIDPSYDLTYQAFGMAAASILTGTYYVVSSHGGGAQSVAEAYLKSARTSIGTTAMMGLVNERLTTSQGPFLYSPMPPADLALTRNKTLGELVEEFSRNLTLSLFSSTRLWYAIRLPHLGLMSPNPSHTRKTVAFRANLNQGPIPVTRQISHTKARLTCMPTTPITYGQRMASPSS